MAGLAVGSKFSAVLLALPLAVAALYRLPAASLGRKALIVGGRLAAAGAVALVVFVLTNPFAVIEFPAYVRQIMAQNAMVSGLMDAPYTRQYIGTLPYLYFVQQLSQWGLGWPLGVVAWGGLIWAVVVAARRRASPTLVVMLAWALPYFAFTGAFHTKFPRYMAPLLPFLAVFGAGAAMAGYRWLAARWGRRGRLAWGALAVGVAVVTLGWALAFTGVYRQEHPWIAASRWIYANIPEGKKLLTEHWDDSLPLTLDELPGKPPIRSYQRDRTPDVGSGHAREARHAGERAEHGGLHRAGEQPAVCADGAPAAAVIRWPASTTGCCLPGISATGRWRSSRPTRGSAGWSSATTTPTRASASTIIRTFWFSRTPAG